MDKPYDVIIAGAGPVSLFLACELRLAQISVLVLERDASLHSEWKRLPLGRRGLNHISIEALYRRGLIYELFSPEERPARIDKLSWAGHFAGMMIPGAYFDLNRFKYQLHGPSLTPGATSYEKLQNTLFDRAKKLGVDFLFDHEISTVEQNDDGVIVKAGAQKLFHGKWLVGCDGGRSAVRKAGGFEFVGTDAKFTGYIIECEFDDPEKVPMGFQLTPQGMFINLRDSLYLMDFDNADFNRKAFDRNQRVDQ